MSRYMDLEFPALAVIVDLGAGALGLAGASRENPVSFVELRERYRPEFKPSGNVAHQLLRAGIHVVVMTYAGIEPDFGDVAGWWQVDDLGQWAFVALVIMVRVAAERTGRPVEELCREISNSRGAQL